MPWSSQKEETPILGELPIYVGDEGPITVIDDEGKHT